MTDWINVALVSDFPPGTWQRVDIDDVEIAVFNVEGNFFAIEDLCTHDDTRLTDGEFCGDEITCPRHAARFNVRSGEALSPPAYEAVATLPTQIVDGMVQVRDDRFD